MHVLTTVGVCNTNSSNQTDYTIASLEEKIYREVSATYELYKEDMLELGESFLNNINRYTYEIQRIKHSQ